MEMEVIRFKIKPLSSFKTNWASDTLMGAVFWSYLRRNGSSALKKLLDSFMDRQPPFLLSSGFPGDLFPRPFLPPRPLTGTRPSLQDIQQAKKHKKVAWVSLAAFNAARKGEALALEEIEPPFIKGLVIHNQIDRLTSTTGGTGTMFSCEETFLNEHHYPYLSIYAYVQPKWKEELIDLIQDVGKTGLGGRSSTGKGVFVLESYETFSGFTPVENPNACITLGHMVPHATDPVKGFYKTIIKRGRLGEERARLSNPFKKPLVMFIPGASFYDAGQRQFLGRMVSNIAQAASDAVHCGMVPVVPARLRDFE